MQKREDLQALFAKALENHQQGQLQEAQKIYLGIVQLIPDSGPIWALLGTLMIQLEQISLGIRYFALSLNLDPFNPATRSNLGNAFREISDHTKAGDQLRFSLVLKPDHIDALLNLGQVLREQKDPILAGRYIEHAIKVTPNLPEPRIALAMAMTDAGHIGRGFTLFKAAIILYPSGSPAYSHFGDSLISAGDFGLAVDLFKRAIHIVPNTPQAFFGLGNAYLASHEYQKAIYNFDSALQSDNKLALRACLGIAACLVGLGNGDASFDYYNQAESLGGDVVETALGKAQACSSMEQHALAIDWAKRAITLRPNSTLAYLILANILYEKGDNSWALQLFARATNIEPDNAEAHVNRSIVHLKSGDFEIGWALYAKRLEGKSLEAERKFLSHKTCTPGFSAESIWIWNEQGVGDQVFFCSVLSDIQHDFKNIIVTLDSRLIPILTRSFPEITFTENKEIPESNYDGQLPMASLPLVFRKLMGEPRPKAFLQSDPERAKRIRSQLLSKGKILCGLSWESQRKDRGKEKSMTLTELLPILEMPDLEFVNLQYGNVSDQLVDLERRTGVVIQQYREIDNFSDLDGLTSLIDACDFVVSTCNSTAHFAGALGKETYLLAPLRGKAQQWYWASFGGPESPWYPSVSVFHQGEGRDWQNPISKIKQKILLKWVRHIEA